MAPTINAGQDGADLSYTEVFRDDFDQAAGPFSANTNWRIETMTGNNASVHQAGNFGQDRNGNIGSGLVVDGARWAGWYDEHHDKTLRYTGDALELKAFKSNESNPTRTDYVDGSDQINASQSKLFVGWIDQFARAFDSGSGLQIPDTSAPNITYQPGHYFEMELDISDQLPDGHRLSWWIMPATDNDGNVQKIVDGQVTDAAPAYDGEPSTGCEIDIFEIERHPGTFENSFLMKVIAGGTNGNSPNDKVDLTSFNIRTGKHKIGLLWMPDRLVWYCDGQEVQRDEDRVPQVPGYMIVSEEVNTGVGSNPPAIDPKRPVDFGLFGGNCYAFADDFVNSSTRIHYISAYSVDTVIAPPTPNPVDPVTTGKPAANLGDIVTIITDSTEDGSWDIPASLSSFVTTLTPLDQKRLKLRYSTNVPADVSGVIRWVLD